MNITDRHKATSSTVHEASAGTRASLPAAWEAAIDRLRARREARSAVRTIERELAGISTPAERLDMLARYEAAEIADGPGARPWR